MQGYRPDSELMWWQLAKNLYDAQLSLANAMSHNVGDPRSAHALYERLREGQAILLEIFRAKGLLPGSLLGSSGSFEARPSAVPMPFAPPPSVAQVPSAPQAGAPVPPAEPTIAAPPMVDPAGVVEPGQRHAMLKSLAGAMRFRGASYDEIEGELLAVNQARCNPPKFDSEVKAIARWASEQPMTNGVHRPHMGEPAVSEADQQAVVAALEPESVEAAALGGSPEEAEPSLSAEPVAPGSVAEVTELAPASVAPVAPPRSGSING